ncbi:hypothetical protein CEP52_007767 [Fusarium oligoseptatum]|uniref:Uncharacterized protein n=1 Tax=Fusarium oligoseptatum TaxID=2604345 RepID=A0A428TLG6_9HYPO|nr:hypothetical protein CEP52_007767 [Fusarium oligoseptatum]
MESYGLGSTTDILLCMVPALSSRHLLPNQAILKLMPRVGPGQGWAETAICHKKLLETIKTDKVSEEDRFSVNIVVASMDFLSFAYEPYDERTKPPQDLDDELGAIAQELLSSKFTTIMERLAPIYRRQFRHELFYNALQYPAGPVRGLDEDFAKNILGFTRYHLMVFSISNVGDLYSSQYYIMQEIEKIVKARDIFGWTPYHYAFIGTRGKLAPVFHRVIPERAFERLPSMLDNLGRGPIQFATLAGMHDRLWFMLSRLSNEGRKRAIQASGIDDMTLLHLAAKGGSIDCLDELMSTAEGKALLAKKDIWGRQALHIASKFGHEEIVTKLLEMGSRSDELDDAGKCPVDYFVQRRKEKGLESGIQGQHSNDSEGNDSPSKESEGGYKLTKESLDLFLKFAMEPHCRYSNGRSFLHFAAQVASDENIRTLVREKGFDVEARDNDGRTPLHYAILSGRPSVASTLIKDLGAKSSAKDSHNTTALMFAAQENLTDVAQTILDACDLGFVDEVDDDEKAAIHYARSRKTVDFLIRNECDMLATDSEGRTALHTAIRRKDKDVALYLLGLAGSRQVQTEPFDDTESLLVTACRRGLSEVVPEILRRWPHIINTEDTACGQLPISWACEYGHSEVVAKLLQHECSERVDVNKAEEWMNYTPLHFAAEAEDSKSLALLLKQPTAEIHRQGDEGETPLRLAVRHDRKDAVRMLLQDHRTTLEERVHYIQDFTSSSSSVLHSIIGDMLETFADTSLILRYFLWLFDHTAAPGAQEPINKFVGDLKRGEWKKLKTPYHIAILLGDAEFLQILKEENAPQGWLDEDNWSLVDYIKRFDRNGTLTSLVDSFQPLDTNTEHEHREPTALICAFPESQIKVTSCTTEGHNNCSKIHDVEVTKGQWYRPFRRRACIRSDHSIPPSGKYFYFEVGVLRDSESG